MKKILSVRLLNDETKHKNLALNNQYNIKYFTIINKKL